MRRRTELILTTAIVAALAVVGVAMAISATTNQQKPSYNVAQVYITSWNIDPDGTETMDVKFKISLDLNGDGTYEVERESDVFAGTHVEMAPFRLGGPIETSVSKFAFKIEVYRSVDGAFHPLSYTFDGSVPVNDGTNVVDASRAWEFNAASVSESDSAECDITYAYYVS